MTAPSQDAIARRPQKLAIVHLLGWMLGVGAVLAIYRANTDESQYSGGWLLTVRLTQLGMGLAYGTAISGLGLFAWRWWRGMLHGPTQPGHWLLIFGGVGLLVDFGTTAADEGLLALSGTGVTIAYFGAWCAHQTFVWWLASQIALAVLLKLRDAPFWWWATALITFAVLTANAIASNVSLVGFAAGASGAWIWKVPLMVRVGGGSLALLALAIAALADWRTGRPRDWQHLGGVAAALGLGLVDVVSNSVSLWR